MGYLMVLYVLFEVELVFIIVKMVEVNISVMVLLVMDLYLGVCGD